MKKIKSIISLTLAISVLGVNPLVQAKVFCNTEIETNAKNSQQKKESRFIVKIKKDADKKRIKNKLANNIVVSHEKKDQQYLEESDILDVSLNTVKKQEIVNDDSLVVEPNYIMNGLEKPEKKIRVQKKMPVLKNRKEYSEDPTKFIPADYDKKNHKDIIPWNIANVAGGTKIKKNNAQGIKIAVIDSGIDVHDDLNTKGWVDFSDRVNGYKPIDNCGHGTEVAGVLAGRINNMGVVGLAQGASIYSLKVLNSENQSTVSNVIKAINWCIDNKIDIINMSFGMDKYSEILENTINDAANHNILMVAAAGNEKKVEYPAKYKNVLSVGAINDKNEVAEFSPSDESVDVYAPGVNINTTGYVGSYVLTDGTSLAAPHVTATAAVLMKRYPKLNMKDITAIIRNSSKEVKNTKAGAVSLYSAIKYAKHYKRENQSEKMYADYKTKIISQESFSESDVVEGTWSKDKWKDTIGNIGSGHLSMINSMPLEFFAEGTPDVTGQENNKKIVGLAAKHIDDEAYCIEKWKNINANKEYKYSPYHATPHYEDAEIQFTENFLYEFARRRLVYRSMLDTNVNNYNNKDSYYGVWIDNSMKKSIVRDMSKLMTTIQGYFDVKIVNMRTALHSGYMLMGVLLHTQADYLCHRAKVDINMITKRSGESVCTDWYGDACWNSRIYEGNFTTEGYKKCKKYINKYKAIPVVRLKDCLKSNFKVYCNNKEYSVTLNTAYEDNPYWYSNRYSASYNQNYETLSEMKKHKAEFTLYQYNLWGVYTYDDKFNYKDW